MHYEHQSSKYKNLFISKSFEQKGTKIYTLFYIVITLLWKTFSPSPTPLTLLFFEPRILKKSFFIILDCKCPKISQTMKIMSQNRYIVNSWNISLKRSDFGITQVALLALFGQTFNVFPYFVPNHYQPWFMRRTFSKKYRSERHFVTIFMSVSKNFVWSLLGRHFKTHTGWVLISNGSLFCTDQW